MYNKDYLFEKESDESASLLLSSSSSSSSKNCDSNENSPLLNKTLLPLPKSSRQIVKLELSDVLPKTYEAQLCLHNKTLGNSLFIASLVRDCSYQTYFSYLAYLKPLEQKAKLVAMNRQMNEQNFDGSNATLSEVN